MLTLHNRVSLVKKRKVIGRGGKRGGTSGAGNKGQKARTGSKIGVAFEGGQMPLYRRLPKRGFNNFPHQVETYIVNLEQLDKKFENGETVDAQSLIAKNIIKPPLNKRYQVKILGNGELTKKLVVSVDALSASAQKAIEKVGGQVRVAKDA